MGPNSGAIFYWSQGHQHGASGLSSLRPTGIASSRTPFGRGWGGSLWPRGNFSLLLGSFLNPGGEHRVEGGTGIGTNRPPVPHSGVSGDS